MKKCTNCGEQLTEAAKFCSHCGVSTEKGSEAELFNTELPFGSATKENFFLKYWRGNYTLGESAVIFILINILSNRVLKLILGYISTLSKKNIVYVRLAILPFLTLAFFQVIGAWRSANKHRGNQIWRYLAYILILLSVLGGIGL